MSRPVFVGNFEYETRQSELERLFSKYGRVERVDMKSGKNNMVFISSYVLFFTTTANVSVSVSRVLYLAVNVLVWSGAELLLREIELLSGLANFSAKNSYCNGYFHMPACSPSILRWHHPAFSSYDLLSLTHLTAKFSISPEWSWCRIIFSSSQGKENPDFADVLQVVDLIPPSFIITTASDCSHGFAGFAFVYFEDDRDASDSIRGLDNAPFGHDRRRLSVEWARGERGRFREDSRSMTNQRPTKTLFVINFDPIRTRERDIKRHFEPYGNVVHVRIRRNFAFVQFETQEDATKALDATNRRVISVEYALKDDGERGDKYDSPRRGYGRRGDSPYGRSPSPAYRRRPSPDYGPARSPVYDRYNGPVYDRRRSPGPAYDRQRSPDYGRNRSPAYADHQLEGQEHEESSACWEEACPTLDIFTFMLSVVITA
ncbi:hypothetical protein JRO89_XS01G0338400 [Xanthoceras sorbifolium]|uniref:RRM domain-containing protein n=1 Tax=Xanthoceras sorbifolium TaxID=99658 RepID=A0ABQ8IN96_9ROSI|nr:hypothetical protein JRO89_XS01G0338400 [Xanthoceras sorbifolium]